jgi:hypothetical protein
MSLMSRNRNKTQELTIDINARNRENIENDTTFFSMDAGTAEKIINFTRDHMAYDLTGAEVHIAFHFVDERATKIIDSVDGSVEIVEAVEGRCSVKIPSHVYDYNGDVMVHVYIILDEGKSIDCGVIPTTFKRSWIGEELPELERTSIERYNRLMEMANEIKRKLEDLDKASDEDISVHINNTNNPHGVTAQQIEAAPANHTHDWNRITNRPTTFVPSHHTHDWQDITNRPALLEPSKHQHSANDINRGRLHVDRLPTGAATRSWVNNRPGLTTTPWEVLRVLNGTNVNGNSTLQYRRSGRKVYVRGTLTHITGLRVVARLPVGFRPGRSYEFVQTISGTTGCIGRWRVRSRSATSTTGADISGNFELLGATEKLAASNNHYIYLSFPI